MINAVIDVAFFFLLGKKTADYHVQLILMHFILFIFFIFIFFVVFLFIYILFFYANCIYTKKAQY